MYSLVWSRPGISDSSNCRRCADEVSKPMNNWNHVGTAPPYAFHHPRAFVSAARLTRTSVISGGMAYSSHMAFTSSARTGPAPASSRQIFWREYSS